MTRRALAWCLAAVACFPDADSNGTTTTDAASGSSSGSTTSESSTRLPTESVSSTSPATSTSTHGVGTTRGSSSGEDSTGAEDPWGTIEGDCGVLDPVQLGSADPAKFDNAIDFHRVGFDYDRLTEGGKTIHDTGNLGGSSLLSEVVAFEVLARCEGAQLLKTESEIEYIDSMATKTDLLVDVDGVVVGVSVTRAFAFPPRDPYTEQQATELLTDKLGDILVSNDNVAAEDAWSKHVLHVIAYEDMHAQSIATAYETLDTALRADTIVIVTVTDGDDAFAYD